MLNRTLPPSPALAAPPQTTPKVKSQPTATLSGSSPSSTTPLVFGRRPSQAQSDWFEPLDSDAYNALKRKDPQEAKRQEKYDSIQRDMFSDAQNDGVRRTLKDKFIDCYEFDTRKELMLHLKEARFIKPAPLLNLDSLKFILGYNISLPKAGKIKQEGYIASIGRRTHMHNMRSLHNLLGKFFKGQSLEVQAEKGLASAPSFLEEAYKEKKDDLTQQLEQCTEALQYAKKYKNRHHHGTQYEALKLQQKGLQERIANLKIPVEVWQINYKGLRPVGQNHSIYSPEGNLRKGIVFGPVLENEQAQLVFLFPPSVAKSFGRDLKALLDQQLAHRHGREYEHLYKPESYYGNGREHEHEYRHEQGSGSKSFPVSNKAFHIFKPYR